MNSDGLPNHETLLEWMSAFLDGELSPGEEALLEQAMNADPELLRAFEQMTAGMSASELSMRAIAPEAPLSDAESDDLTRSVLAACVPEALDESAESAAGLMSLYLDDALDPAGQDRLFALLEGPLHESDDVARFAQTSEAVGTTLHALPTSPAVTKLLAPLPARIEAAVAEEERFGLLWSAALDGELSPEEEAELEVLLSTGPAGRASDALPFAHVAEACQVTLRTAIDHPDAARAGASALQAIAAYEAQAAFGRRPKPAPEPAARLSLPRLLARFFPVALAASAAVAFTVLQRPPSERDASDVDTAPPAEWVAAFQGDAPGVDPLTLLDNNEAEVQAIDAGTHMAAVFSTEESQITVIWVPEPETDTETGT